MIKNFRMDWSNHTPTFLELYINTLARNACLFLKRIWQNQDTINQDFNYSLFNIGLGTAKNLTI